MGGKPCIRGLRVTVGTIVGLIASGYSTADILKLYPYLEPEDLRRSINLRGVALRRNRIAIDHSVRILIDMNLAPGWTDVFASHGMTAVHWSTIGDPRAEDNDLMEWVRINGHVVFTHDLDFGTMLALTQATSPSVIQVRTQDVTPSHLAITVIDVLQNNKTLLKSGALIVLDEGRSRVRILLLTRRN